MHKSKTGCLPVSGAGQSALIEDQVCEVLVAFQARSERASVGRHWEAVVRHPPPSGICGVHSVRRCASCSRGLDTACGRELVLAEAVPAAPNDVKSTNLLPPPSKQNACVGPGGQRWVEVESKVEVVERASLAFLFSTSTAHCCLVSAKPAQCLSTQDCLNLADCTSQLLVH